MITSCFNDRAKAVDQDDFGLWLSVVEGEVVEGTGRQGNGAGHADFYFQQRSIWLRRIIDVTNRDEGFNSDKSFIDRILASRIMHPPVLNHGELSNRTERQHDTDRQGRTANIMDSIYSRKESFPAGLRPRG
jgi:hypothetical protein